VRAILGIVGLLSFSCSVSAQQTALNGPIEGFTFDTPSHSLRAVIGTLGSASLGPILFALADSASIAPHKDYGIVAARGEYVFVSDLKSGKASSRGLDLSPSVGDQIAWSSDGSMALLYSRADNSIRLLTGIPDSPTIGSPADLSLMGGAVNTIAIARTPTHGSQIAIAMAGASAGVYGIKDGAGPVLLLPLTDPSALVFSDDDATLYALDKTTNSVTALTISNNASYSWPLDGLKGASAIAIGRDSSNQPLLYVASRRDRALSVYDVTTRQSTTNLSLSFEPDGIQPLGRASFLLAPRMSDGDALWSLKTVPSPAIFFIPATPLHSLKLPVAPHRPTSASQIR
jgi:hypothetical protein